MFLRLILRGSLVTYVNFVLDKNNISIKNKSLEPQAFYISTDEDIDKRFVIFFTKE